VQLIIYSADARGRRTDLRARFFRARRGTRAFEVQVNNLLSLAMPKTKKRNRGRESASDTSSTSTPNNKRSCSGRRGDQRPITEFTNVVERASNTDEKLDKVLEGISEIRAVRSLTETLQTTVEQLRGEVLEWTHACRKLQSDLEHQKKMTERASQEATDAKLSANLAWSRLDDIEQWNRRSSVRILNLPDNDERETHIQCLRRVTEFLRHNLKMTYFNPDEIDICHRVGRFSRDGRPRQIVVKFMRRTTKIAVMEHRPRGSPPGSPFVVEDLTRRRYNLMRRARLNPDVTNTWSRDGHIYARLRGDRVTRITDNTDWGKLGEQSASSSNPGHRERPYPGPHKPSEAHGSAWEYSRQRPRSQHRSPPPQSVPFPRQPYPDSWSPRGWRVHQQHHRGPWGPAAPSSQPECSRSASSPSLPVRDCQKRGNCFSAAVAAPPVNAAIPSEDVSVLPTDATTPPAEMADPRSRAGSLAGAALPPWDSAGHPVDGAVGESGELPFVSIAGGGGVPTGTPAVSPRKLGVEEETTAKETLTGESEETAPSDLGDSGKVEGSSSPPRSQSVAPGDDSDSSGMKE